MGGMAYGGSREPWKMGFGEQGNRVDQFRWKSGLNYYIYLAIGRSEMKTAMAAMTILRLQRADYGKGC